MSANAPDGWVVETDLIECAKLAMVTVIHPDGRRNQGNVRADSTPDRYADLVNRLVRELTEAG